MKLSGAAWNLVKTAGGAIVGLAGFLGWMNVSPEQAGQAIFDFLRIALPVATFVGGFLFSWGIFGAMHEKKVEALQNELSECRKDADDSWKLLDDMRNRVAIYAAAHGKDVDEFIREAVEKAVAEKVDERKLVDQAVRKVEEKRERQEDPRYRKYRSLQAEREYKAEKRKKRGW